LTGGGEVPHCSSRRLVEPLVLRSAATTAGRFAAHDGHRLPLLNAPDDYRRLLVRLRMREALAPSRDLGRL